MRDGIEVSARKDERVTVMVPTSDAHAERRGVILDVDEARDFAQRIEQAATRADTGLLTYHPGSEVYVRNNRTGDQVVAQADDDGIVRNDDGEAYSDGAYSIVGEADDAA